MLPEGPVCHELIVQHAGQLREPSTGARSLVGNRGTISLPGNHLPEKFLVGLSKMP